MSLPLKIGASDPSGSNGRIQCPVAINTRSVIFQASGTNSDSISQAYPQNFRSFWLPFVNDYDINSIPWGQWVGIDYFQNVTTGSVGTHFESNASWTSVGNPGGAGSWIWDGQLVRTQISLTSVIECPPRYMIICYEDYSTYVNGQFVSQTCFSQLGCTSQLGQGELIIDLPIPQFLDPSLGQRNTNPPQGLPGYTVSYYFALVGTEDQFSCPVQYPDLKTFVADWAFTCYWDDTNTCMETTGSNFNTASICALGNPFPTFSP